MSEEITLQFIYTPVVRGTFNLTITIDPENKNSNTGTCILLTILQRGDVVRDNEVDIVDAYYIPRYTVGLEPEPDGFVADVTPAYTQDGVDIVDAYYIARYTIGLEVAPWNRID